MVIGDVVGRRMSQELDKPLTALEILEIDNDAAGRFAIANLSGVYKIAAIGGGGGKRGM